MKKVFLDISQNSQEKHLRQSLFFNKVEDLRQHGIAYNNGQIICKKLKKLSKIKQDQRISISVCA